MAQITPLIHQYRKIKEKYKDCILFFQVGDFYETFFEDAKLISKVLQIALTKRQEGVPLAGVPIHAAQPYIERLVKEGYKVAICQQLEEPKPGKIVKRGVVEVITQGTIVDSEILPTKEYNFLMAIYKENKKAGIAIVDVSTGEFLTTELDDNELQDEIDRLSPKEILIPENMEDFNYQNITRLPLSYFDEVMAEEILKEHFGVYTLSGFGIEDKPLCKRSSGAVLQYIRETKRSKAEHIKKLRFYRRKDYMIIDDATRRNLELIKKIGTDDKKGTLLWVMDNTLTPMGARLLRKEILAPLIDKKKIEERLELTDVFYQNKDLLKEIREKLEKISDIERITTKIALERANPRDLIALKNSIKILPEINKILEKSEKLKNLKLKELRKIYELIDKAIVENPPQTITEGGILKKGYMKELDELREISLNSKKLISEMEERERRRTGIQSLKIGYNTVFGYYIEVTKANLKYVPKDYIRKQTLVNAERFVTEELKRLEEKILSCEEKIKQIEYEEFCKIRRKIKEKIEDLQEVSEKLGFIDLISNFAYISIKNNYRKPEIHDGYEIVIKRGRHPVVEKLIEEEFIPNDTVLNDNQQILIITGPNMSGKSTYLRQVALIVIMAQMGCFVPADYAKIGIVDRVFTRIGASDDLSRGVSTFLAEMIETSNILNNATKRSLVLLDEIGRGTSTFDGMAIAWATTEYLLKNVGCKTLFATHYHELVDLQTISSKIKNFHFSAKRYKDRLIFMRELRAGGCDDSFGIDVAKMAGIPDDVVKRARKLLSEMEKLHRKWREDRTKSRQKELFFEKEEKKEHPVIEELRKIDINNMTPIEALLKLKELKEKFA